MKRKLLTVGFLISFAGVSAAQTSEKQIEPIRKIYSDTNLIIVEMHKEPELSSVFAVELTVNKYSAPYPAVGIYQRTATFYYTYGDREKNPYPDRLLRISAVYRRSASVQKADFYFNHAGELVFVFMANAGAAIDETRLYFADGRLIRMIDDGRDIGLRTKRAVDAGTNARKEAARLAGIFRAALIDNV